MINMDFSQIYGFYLDNYVVPRYEVKGAILGCLGTDANEVSYMVVQKLPEDDPWIAIIQSAQPITNRELHKWHNLHNVDIDHKGIPYYFIVKDTFTNKQYVWYSDQDEMTPIEYAKELGIKKGLDPQQLDFDNTGDQNAI